MGLYYDSPPEPDYGAAARESAEAQADLLPLQYETELEYRPKFDELEFQQQMRSQEAMLNWLLGDEEAGTEGFFPALQEMDQQSQAAALERALEAARAGYELDAEYLPQMADLNAQTQLELQQKYGDQFVDEALSQAERMDPDWFETRDAVADMIMSDLAMGNELSPEQERAITQKFRKGQAARGNLYGGQVSLDEALQQFLAGEDLKQQRLTNASAFLAGQQPSSQTAGVQTAQGGAAPYQVMAPGSLSTYNAGQGTNYAANPMSFGFGNAGSVWDRNAVNQGTQSIYGFQGQNFLANQDAKQSFWGDLAGSAMGMAGGAMMFCWVAREVYGADNPKWKQFREWMLEDAPPDLREAYGKHGEAYAEHIRNNPALKARWRKFMDAAIREHELVGNAE